MLSVGILNFPVNDGLLFRPNGTSWIQFHLRKADSDYSRIRSIKFLILTSRLLRLES